jgi:DNA-binding response OmpR family regulator
MKASTNRGLSVALLDTDTEPSAALRETLFRLGHGLTVFVNAADLMTTLSDGQRFDLLLATAQEQEIHMSLSEVCARLCMPMLHIVQSQEWQFLPMGGETMWDDAIDLAAFLQTGTCELDWRIQSLVQRTRASVTTPWLDKEMTWGEYTFKPDSSTVQHRGRTIYLTRLEFSFAFELFQNLGRILSRDGLLKKLWGRKALLGRTRIVDVCASKTRTKLDLRHENGFVLRSIYGRGYQLVSVSQAGEGPDAPRCS